MSDWNPSLYLKFEAQRTQPAADLAVRAADYHPHTAADLGCGPGNSTRVLQQAIPGAEILGIDSSPNMIAKAQASHPGLRFQTGDVRKLTGRYDLLFSNACLQWIPDHPSLIPALMENLNPGGVLAVQVPMNGEETLFRLIRETAGEARWGLEGFDPPNQTLTPAEYYDILSGCSASFDIWETKYYHTLPDHRALIDWVKGTRLRPYLDRLRECQRERFEQALLERSQALYPVMKNGCVVLGFRRFFFTAVK